MRLQRLKPLPTCEPSRPRPRIRPAALLTTLAMLLTTFFSTQAGAQSGSNDNPNQDPGSARVTCEETVVVFQLLCIAYQVISDNHIDPVDDADLAREAVNRIREAKLAERTEGTPTPCPLPAPEFEEVCREIDRVEDTAMAVEMAMRGMVRALDENSYFLTAAQYDRFLEAIENRGITGLGLAFALTDDGEACFEVSTSCVPVISEVYEGTPAHEAGLAVGDVLEKLGNVFPADLKCSAVPGLDRFPAGTGVAITVRRGTETVSTTITAADLAIPAARGRLVDDEIGLLRLDSFGSSAGQDVREVLERLTNTGASALVFDLRGNPGGYVDSAVGVAGLFLPNLTTVVQLVSREQAESIGARGKELYPDPILLPMVVVTDNRSASASELVTGALHDHGRVTTVGERTYGKNTGQSSYRLHLEGRTVAVIHLTTIRWLTPDSRSADGGFGPDVAMELPSCLPPAEVARRAVSAIRPRVTGVAITSTPQHKAGYAAGESVKLAVSFTSPVVVVASGATPQLELRIGESNRFALYRAGSGTSRLVFEYLVTENDNDEDGITVEPDSLFTGRANIQLPGGLDANLSHAAAAPDPTQLVTGSSRDRPDDHPAFVDIAASPHRTGIEIITTAAIAEGCGNADSRRFCPDDPVTRGQMATYLARLLDLPAADLDHFTDDNGTTHENNINSLAATGITQGCDNHRYCPDQPITRGQTATYLARVLDLPAADLDHFTDDNGTTHENNINSLAATGITQGCDNHRYCPDQPITRGQMATYLARVLDRLAAANPPVVEEGFKGP